MVRVLKVKKGSKYISDALKIAKGLKEWFNENGINNIKTDLNLNNVAVALGNGETLGFICYSSYDGILQLIWMAVEKNHHGQGVGTALIRWAEKEGRKHGLKLIQLETLPDEDGYEPYKRTREFYYKNGFVRVAYKKARIKGYDDQIVLEKKL